MDKVKAAAEKAAAEAKKGTAQVKEKIGDAQLRRKADDAAKRLGYLIVKERAEGQPAGEETDRLVEEIASLEKQIEAEGGAGAETAPTATETETPAPPSTAADAAPGDFKLE
jgi:hypothetical protein